MRAVKYSNPAPYLLQQLRFSRWPLSPFRGKGLTPAESRDAPPIPLTIGPAKMGVWGEGEIHQRLP